jgi:hypothetical protein
LASHPYFRVKISAVHIGRAIRGGFPIGSRRQTSRTNPCDQPSLPWGLQTSAVLNEPLTLNGQMQTMALCLCRALVLSFPVALGYAPPRDRFLHRAGSWSREGDKSGFRYWLRALKRRTNQCPSRQEPSRKAFSPARFT